MLLGNNTAPSYRNSDLPFGAIRKYDQKNYYKYIYCRCRKKDKKYPK